MPEMTVRKPSARERLLAAAGELFYEEGVRSVGIERVLERANVSKGSLYNHFGSKDELVRAYLEDRHHQWEERIMRAVEAPGQTSRDRILDIFDVQTDFFAEPNFRGCALVNASAESAPGSLVEQVSDTSRAWVLALFTRLAGEAGARDPAKLAGQLVVLYDGASVAARMDRDPTVGVTAREMAAALLEAAIS